MKRNSSYNNANTDLSEDDLMECEPTLFGCDGADIITYTSSVSCRGQSTEATAPYNYADGNYCPAGDARAAERDAMKATLNFKWATVPRSNANLTRAVATAPTQIGVKADGYAFQYYTSGIVGCSVESKSAVVNHAVTVVGYGVSGRTPYFLVKNSWGTGWGEAVRR
uniref:Peptidase C1A papain C-terminal domain-containing protein n=1 Tax=Tetradesmus obliquus TaxID=3088 RepID=A0A383VUB5_TETOB|eukprot:jgi/Sobl393_1/5163/SZX67996.1